MGLIHSGREGSRKNIIGKALKMIKARKINLDSIHLAIWPGICKKCYEIDHGHASDFPKEFWERNGNMKIKLDLRSVIVNQIMEMGISKEQITTTNCDTFCSYHTVDDNNKPMFFSHYRDRGKEEGMFRNAVFVTN